MKRFPLIISHVLVLVVAFLIGRGLVGRTSDGANDSPASKAGTGASTTAKSSRGSPTGADGARSARRRSPAEYAAAWQGLAAKRLSRTERQRLQVELLKAWAEVDLKGALTAALDEPWHEISWPGQIEQLLRKGFEEAFVDQSLWSNKDPERSRAALDQIKDPEFQKEAEKWRQQWEKQMGWKEE